MSVAGPTVTAWANPPDRDSSAVGCGPTGVRHGRGLAARHHVRRGGPRDHRWAGHRIRAGTARPRPDHRDRRRQGAGRGGARRAGHPRRPRSVHPAPDRRAHGDHDGHGLRCAADRIGAAVVPGVLPRRRPRRAQLRLRHRVPEGRRQALSARLAAAAGAVHGQAGPPRADPRGGAQRAPVRTGAAVRCHHHPDPPRARRRARHGRRAACPHRAHRKPGRALLCRPAVVSARRDTRPAPQAPPGGRRPEQPRGVPVPRARRRGPLRRHRGRSAAAGRAVLQRRRSAHPDEGDGGAGHPRRPRRVRARARGRRAGTAAPGRPRAAVQPAVEVSAPVVVGGAHRRALPPLLGGSGAQARPHRRTVPLPRRRGRDRGAAGPIHRRAHVHRAAGPCGAARALLRGTRAVAVPGATRRRRRRVRRGPAAGGPPDRGRRRRRPVRGARPRRRPCRRWPLRDRGTAARPRRDGDRRTVAWATAARPDRRRRAGGGPAGR